LPPAHPPPAVSSFVGVDTSSVEPALKKSMIEVKASIDGEDEREWESGISVVLQQELSEEWKGQPSTGVIYTSS